MIRGGPPTFVTEIIDTQGNSLQIGRQSNGRLTTVGGQSRNVRFSYGGNGFVSQMTDSANRTMRFTYTAGNRIETITDADNKVTRYAYVGDSEIAADAVCPVQPTGGERIKTIHYPGKTNPTENFYGAGRRVIRQTLPDGREFRFNYKVTGACVTNVSTPGQICSGPQCPTEDTWDNYQAGWRIHGGRIVAATVIKPDGNSRTHNFNARGAITSYVDEQGQATAYKYDSKNRMIESKDALGRVTRYEYDARGNRTAMFDALQRVRRYTFDTKWNQVSSITRYNDPSPFGQGNPKTELMTYDAATGVLTSQTTALNRRTEMTYTTRGQMSSVVSPMKRVSRYEYAQNGDLTKAMILSVTSSSSREIPLVVRPVSTTPWASAATSNSMASHRSQGRPMHSVRKPDLHLMTHAVCNRSPIR